MILPLQRVVQKREQIDLQPGSTSVMMRCSVVRPTESPQPREGMTHLRTTWN